MALGANYTVTGCVATLAIVALLTPLSMGGDSTIIIVACCASLVGSAITMLLLELRKKT